jgi:hypothetical protein
MGWPSTLSYQQVIATGIARSLPVLAHYGDIEAVTAALAADPTLADDPQALVAAAENGHESIVRLILSHQPGVIQRVAVVARTRELTEFLFQSGMNPDLAGWLGVTPLHRFAREGDVEKAAIFLEHGANLHVRDEEFCTTPLGYAAAAGRQRMVEFLLRRGSKVSLPDDFPWATPVALAAYKGHDEIVRVLKEFESTRSLSRYRLEALQALARDLVTACQSGDGDAFQRVVDHFYIRRPMTWDRPGEVTRASRLRRFVRERLHLPHSQTANDTVELSDAQSLIARSYGFHSWRDLESSPDVRTD